MYNIVGSYGWICPRCGKVNAPFVPNCSCTESVTTSTCGNETVVMHDYKPDLTKEHNHIPHIDTYYGECGEDSDDEQN